MAWRRSAQESVEAEQRSGLIMSLAGTENVREVQSFPKTQTGYDPLLDAPAEIDPKLLEELGLRVVVKPPKA